MRTGITAFAAALIVCSWGMWQSADAAKTKFERTKPHVNVGTTQRDDRSHEEPRLKQGGDAPSSGMPTGKRRHMPFTIIRPVDK